MSVEDKFIKKNIEVQNRMKKEIEQVSKGECLKSTVQLNYILMELENMINKKGLALCYPRMVIDTWNFNDELGIELLELAELYKKLK